MAETENKAVIRFNTSDAGLQLQTMDDVWRFAQGCVEGGLVPQNTRVAEVAMRIQIGVELGFTPAAALQAVKMIKDKPGLEGETMLALIISKDVDDPRGPIDCGHSREQGAEGELGQLVGWCESWRKGWPKSRRTEFSWNDAVLAGLTKARGKNSTPSLYTKYPKDMLQWKAVARHAKRYYNDILKGIHMAQELTEIAAAEYEVNEPVASTSQPAPIDGLLAGVVEADGSRVSSFCTDETTRFTEAIERNERAEDPTDALYTPPAEPCCARKPGHDGDCLPVEVIEPEVLKTDGADFPADTGGGFE